MKNTCAVIVIYFPKDEHIENILTLSQYVETVIVIDNTPYKDNNKPASNFPPNIHHFPLNKNYGLGYALNFGIEKAYDLKYEFCFLFDQDSKISNDYIQNMVNFMNLYSSDDVVLFAPNFYDRNSNTYATFSSIYGWKYINKHCENSDQILDTTFAITSGSLLHIDKWNKIGRFKDEYFIDHIDSEFCLRAKYYGLKILINCSVVLNHSIGNRTKHKLLGLVTLKPNHHNEYRRYYIARNGIDMILRHFRHSPGIIFLNSARLLHEILAIIFYEKNKFKKLKAIVIGILDGFLNNLGECRRKI